MAKQSNFHESFVRKDQGRRGSDRIFGAVFALFFTIISVTPLLHHAGLRWWSLLVAAGFGAAALLAPPLLSPLNYAWYRFGLLLHLIVSPILIAAVYFCVITPAGLVVRLTGRDSLRLKFDPGADSYWVPRSPPGPSPEDFPRMF